MTVKDVIDGFQEEAGENAERDAYANILFQEALRISMELNNQYHTPEEIREIMSRLTGKKMDGSFRMFPPFYTDFGKNITIGGDVFINSGCHFQDQGGITIGDGSLIMDFSLLTTSGVSQKRNEAVGNKKPPAMRVEDKLLYKKITFPL